MKWLVTGGAGFIGCNFIRLVLASRAQVEIVNLDALTYSGRRENIADFASHPRHRFVHGDICDRELARGLLEGEGIEAVIHFAAESHVDRSLTDASSFIRANVQGTQVLLEEARRAKIPRFLHISTDEVYGSLGAEGRFTEDSPLAPNSPYAASKTAAECFVRAAVHSRGLPAIVTRASNNYGPFQFPEKLIPLAIANLSDNQPVPIYGRGANVRNWIFVEDHCRGVLAALERGQIGGIYNIGGDEELDNLTLVRRLLSAMNKPESLLQFVADRPGHDFRYALDSARARRELGWSPRVGLHAGLELAVRWYGEHADWLASVRDASFHTYYQRQYAAPSMLP